MLFAFSIIMPMLIMWNFTVLILTFKVKRLTWLLERDVFTVKFWGKAGLNLGRVCVGRSRKLALKGQEKAGLVAWRGRGVRNVLGFV